MEVERSSGRRRFRYKKFIPPTYRFNCRSPLRFLFPVYFSISCLRCFLSPRKIDKHLTPATKLLKSHHKTNNRSTSWNDRTTASMQFPEAADVWRWWSTSGRVDAFRVAGSRLASASPFVYLQRFHSIIFLSATRFPSHFSPFLDISSLPRTNKGDGPRKNKWGSKSKGSVAPPLPIFPSLFLDNTSFFLRPPPPLLATLFELLCVAPRRSSSFFALCFRRTQRAIRFRHAERRGERAEIPERRESEGEQPLSSSAC